MATEHHSGSGHQSAASVLKRRHGSDVSAGVDDLQIRISVCMCVNSSAVRCDHIMTEVGEIVNELCQSSNGVVTEVTVLVTLCHITDAEMMLLVWNSYVRTVT